MNNNYDKIDDLLNQLKADSAPKVDVVDGVMNASSSINIMPMAPTKTHRNWKWYFGAAACLSVIAVSLVVIYRTNDYDEAAIDIMLSQVYDADSYQSSQNTLFENETVEAIIFNE